MFGKHMLSIIFVAVGILVTRGDSEIKPPKEVYSERPCLDEGGMCVRADDCPEGKLVEQKGLCPAQQKRGVECCYGLPKSERRCEKRGGQCMTRCHERVTDKEANNCPPGQKCCILVRLV